MNQLHLKCWLVFLSCLSVSLCERMLTWNNCRQSLWNALIASALAALQPFPVKYVVVWSSHSPPFNSPSKKFIKNLKMFVVEGQAQISAKWKRIAQLNLSLLMFCMSVNATKTLFTHFKCLYWIGVFVNEWKIQNIKTSSLLQRGSVELRSSLDLKC